MRIALGVGYADTEVTRAAIRLAEYLTSLGHSCVFSTPGTRPGKTVSPVFDRSLLCGPGSWIEAESDLFLACDLSATAAARSMGESGPRYGVVAYCGAYSSEFMPAYKKAMFVASDNPAVTKAVNEAGGTAFTVPLDAGLPITTKSVGELEKPTLGVFTASRREWDAVSRETWGDFSELGRKLTGCRVKLFAHRRSVSKTGFKLVTDAVRQGWLESVDVPGWAPEWLWSQVSVGVHLGLMLTRNDWLRQALAESGVPVVCAADLPAGQMRQNAYGITVRGEDKIEVAAALMREPGRLLKLGPDVAVACTDRRAEYVRMWSQALKVAAELLHKG